MGNSSVCRNCPALTDSSFGVPFLFRCKEGERYTLSGLRSILQGVQNNSSHIEIVCGKYDTVVITLKGVLENRGFWPVAFDPDEVVRCSFRSRLG